MPDHRPTGDTKAIVLVKVLSGIKTVGRDLLRKTVDGSARISGRFNLSPLLLGEECRFREVFFRPSQAGLVLTSRGPVAAEIMRAPASEDDPAVRAPCRELSAWRNRIRTEMRYLLQCAGTSRRGEE